MSCTPQAPVFGEREARFLRRRDAFFAEIALRGFGRCARRDGFEPDCVGAQFARQAMNKGYRIEACGAQGCAFALECSFGTAVTLNVAPASIMGSAEQRRGRRRSGLQLQMHGEQHKRMPHDRADAFDHHQCANELALLHQLPSLPHPAKHGVERKAQHCCNCRRKGDGAPGHSWSVKAQRTRPDRIRWAVRRTAPTLLLRACQSLGAEAKMRRCAVQGPSHACG